MAELCEPCKGLGLTEQAIPEVCKECTGTGRLGVAVAEEEVEEESSEEEVEEEKPGFVERILGK